MQSLSSRTSRVLAWTLCLLLTLPGVKISAQTSEAKSQVLFDHVAMRRAVRNVVQADDAFLVNSIARPYETEPLSSILAVTQAGASGAGTQRITNSQSLKPAHFLTGIATGSLIVGLGLWGGGQPKKDFQWFDGARYVSTCSKDTDPQTCRKLISVGKSLTVVGAVAFAFGIARFAKTDTGPRVVRRTSAKSVSIRFKNGTSYPLNVRLDGSTPVSKLIQPGQSETLEIAPGRYTQTVETLNGEADSFNTIRAFESGNVYEEGFHTKRD